MVADFKRRHRTGKVDLEQILPYARIVPKLGGNYDRYSCDNSSPTSILDQMAKALDTAQSEGRFVPWGYVFCDYSVSGLDASRQGYTSYKAVLSDPKHRIETTYIDDFTRAGRDEIEWWRLAAKFKQMRDSGASVQTIAAAHGMSWQYASEILHFAETGERPKWKAGKATGNGAKPAKYLQITKEVCYLRDKKKMSIVQIAAKLGVSRGTVCRAYDHEHPQAVREAAERGEPPCRGQYSHLGEDVYDEIRKLLRAGTKPSEVAAKVGCGASTVYRERRRMRAETGEDHAAETIWYHTV